MADKSSVIVRFLGDTSSLDRALGRTVAQTEAAGKKMSGLSDGFAKIGTVGLGAVAVGIGAAVKMGIDWQAQMTTLQTGAGESAKNIGLVSQGLLDMAGQVGTSATDLASGMYMVESAGYHGAAGLQVLKAAAEGAKVGNADMETVANAVTSALNAYHLKASDAATVTNTLIATVASGKMHMQDLAGALGNVLPIASTAGIGLTEVGAALATMTMQGVDANTAATYLRQTIGKLNVLTKAQSDEMKSLGLNAVDLSKNMGKRGLAGTLQLMTDAIVHKMGPSGTVMIEHLKKLAAHTTNFQKALLQLPPAQQTYVAALATMMGGVKTLQGALLLTGANMSTFKGNIKAIGAAAAEGGGKIKGWSEVQKDLSTQIARVVEGAKAWATELGMDLIPYIQKAIDWGQQHADLLKKAAEVFAVVIAAAMAYKVALVALSVGQAVFSALRLAYLTAATAAGSLTAAQNLASLSYEGSTASVWLYTAATKAAAIGQWLMNAALAANPIVWVIAAIAALVAAVVLAYQHVGWFRDFVNKAWADVRAAFGVLRDAGAAALHAVAAAIGWVRGVFDDVVNWFKQRMAFFVGLFALAMPAVMVIILAFRFLQAHGAQIWAAITATLSAAWEHISSVFATVVGVMRRGWTAAWAVIESVARAVWNDAVKPIFDAIATVVGLLVAGLKVLGSVWSTIWGGIKAVILDVWGVIKPILDKIGGAISAIGGGIGKVASVVGSIGSGVGNAISGVGHLLGFADGGVVPGPKGAPMLAVVHGGERVLSTKEQAQGGSGSPLIGHLEIKNYHPVTDTQSIQAGLRQAAFLMGVA